MKSIANYFKSPNRVYYHDVNSLQITLSEIKLWGMIIFDHFVLYPIHGTKIVKLDKLFIIRKLILGKEYLIKKVEPEF